MRLLWLLAVLPVAAAADPPARRHLTNPAADVHLQAGLDAFDTKAYDLASKELDAANALEPMPFLLYTQAQAERLGGHCSRALELYRKYLAADISQEAIELARLNIKLCEQALPTPPVDRSTSGPAHEAPAAPAGHRSKLVPLALGAGATVALGGALGFEVWSDRTYDQAKAEMTDNARRHALEDSADKKRYVALGLAAAGIGCAGVALWLYLRPGPSAATPSSGEAVSARWRVAPMIAGERAGLQLWGGF
jgi:hypothetical protein